MKYLLPLLFLFVLILSACSPTPEAAPTQTPPPSPSPSLSPQKTITPTNTPAPQGKLIPVENTADSGLGSFRAALLLAKSYDTIVFDPEIFNPDNPATIKILEPLAELNTDHLTIDASNAGVVMDGEGNDFGFLSLNNEYITIRGLHIISFNGTAIELWGGANHTIIGGDNKIGDGPLGQGNLITDCRDGILTREGSSYNSFAGNQIGVEFNDLEGNTYSGIQINDLTRGTVIGPDNIIAYSGAPSIDISTGATKGTTITRNLIYGDEIILRMVPPTSNFTPAPVILSYDPAGMVSGIACPGCEVEIFSGEGRWVEFYEGSVIAESDGSFTFIVSGPFSGSNIKANATSSQGSTSQFSLPTPSDSGDLIFQEGNTSLAKIINSLSSDDILEDNRLGTHAFFPYSWRYCLEGSPLQDDFTGMGIKRIRLSFNEMEEWYGLNDQSEYLDGKHEDCINTFQSQGIAISYIISFWDKEARNAGEEVPCERFTNVGLGDPETEDYLQYVREIVGYLSDRGVHEFEIWNEPDNYACTQGIKPGNYIKLIDLLVPVIKETDPEAKIFVRATTGMHAPSSAAYMRTIADADKIMPFVDGLTWHPFYGPSPTFANVANYYYNYPALIAELKTLAQNSGFTGEYRADEMMWIGSRDSEYADAGQPWHYDELVVPKYYVRVSMMHLGLDIATGVNVNMHGYPMVYYAMRNLSTIMAGHKVADLDVTISSSANRLMSYGFKMSNGDHLFALWNNGPAVEYDPGINATLAFTFDGEMPTSATGIDVLHGYTQTLTFEVDGNQLIMRDLRVKDYPMIIQFGYAQ